MALLRGRRHGLSCNVLGCRIGKALFILIRAKARSNALTLDHVVLLSFLHRGLSLLIEGGRSGPTVLPLSELHGHVAFVGLILRGILVLLEVLLLLLAHPRLLLQHLDMLDFFLLLVIHHLGLAVLEAPRNQV